MGIRGLTSYIAQKAELFLEPHELRDCNLIIDGDCLSCNLYSGSIANNSAFNGEYDVYYHMVMKFFHTLAQCNVRPYVIMDGGYEKKKLRTAQDRLRSRIALIKHLDPSNAARVFPLMMREVFVNAVHDSQVPIMRCLFEADCELAALARKIDCPILSYDSDFFIFDVMYVPMSTLTLKVLEKNVDGSPLPPRLRRDYVKVIEKRMLENRIDFRLNSDPDDIPTLKKENTYKYIDCCMYRTATLLKRASLTIEKLPLLAALVGNDYISTSVFRDFFATVRRRVRGKKRNAMQRRIIVVLDWLRGETVESALEKLAGRLKKDRREALVAEVEKATSGYCNEKCIAYDYFVANYKNAFAEFKPQKPNANVSRCPPIGDCTDDRSIFNDDSSDENVSDIESTPSPPHRSGCENDCRKSGESYPLEDDDDIVEESAQFAPWFVEKLNKAVLPRFFVDLLFLRKYINSPQVEHLPYNECNEVAKPILIYIYTLLQSMHETNETVRKGSAKALPAKGFTYITRANCKSNIDFVHCDAQAPPPYTFCPNKPNPMLLRAIFTGFNVDHLFEKLEMLPPDVRLYFLAVAYCLQRSRYFTLIHLHSLIVCLVLLRTVDPKICIERDILLFEKRHGKTVKSEREYREKDINRGVKRFIDPDILSLPIPERMKYIKKSDCYLVMDNVLKHFHMKEPSKKKFEIRSKVILHSFSEFQCVVFQLHSLNALLNFPLPDVRLQKCYCGVFLYNIYEVLVNRADVCHHVKNFIFNYSDMMYDFYEFLLDWCDEFVPAAKRSAGASLVTKKIRAMKRKNDITSATSLIEGMLSEDTEEKSDGD